MADPIRLPNSTPKDLSTTKVTRTARQRFDKRQKKQQRPDMRRQSNNKRQRPSMNFREPGRLVKGLRENKVSQEGQRDGASASLERGQGNVIDVRI